MSFVTVDGFGDTSYFKSVPEQVAQKTATIVATCTMLAIGLSGFSVSNAFDDLPSDDIYMSNVSYNSYDSDVCKTDSVVCENYYISLSNELQETFGFTKKAPWASILKVERKTLYLWRDNPDTNVQERLRERLDALLELSNEMIPGHRKHLAKLTYGRYSIPELSDLLLESKLNVESILDLYDRNITTFDAISKDSLRKELQQRNS